MQFFAVLLIPTILKRRNINNCKYISSLSSFWSILYFFNMKILKLLLGQQIKFEMFFPGRLIKLLINFSTIIPLVIYSVKQRINNFSIIIFSQSCKLSQHISQPIRIRGSHCNKFNDFVGVQMYKTPPFYFCDQT